MEPYRYTLHRNLSAQPALFGAPAAPRMVLFVMLNPSTATETVNDPTVRRCIGFAQAWGFTTLEVCNLFAARSTDPDELLPMPDPVGEHNDREIEAAVARADLVVAAWGTHKAAVAAKDGLSRAAHVSGIIIRTHDLHALKLTAGGHPNHPLYMPADLTPIIYKEKTK